MSVEPIIPGKKYSPEQAAKILALAQEQVGIKESPAGSNRCKFNDWFYLTDKQIIAGEHADGPSKPWCGTAASWVYYHAGCPLGNVGYTNGIAGCSTGLQMLSKWGRLVTVPVPGCIVLHDWQGDGAFDHITIFSKDLGNGLLQTYEGNTSFGNDSNGGEYMKRSDRKYKNAIFILPNALCE